MTGASENPSLSQSAERPSSLPKEFFQEGERLVKAFEMFSAISNDLKKIRDALGNAVGDKIAGRSQRENAILIKVDPNLIRVEHAQADLKDASITEIADKIEFLAGIVASEMNRHSLEEPKQSIRINALNWLVTQIPENKDWRWICQEYESRVDAALKKRVPLEIDPGKIN